MLATEPGPFAERSGAMLRHLEEELSDVISHLKQQGVIPAWVEPEAMASLLIAAANGMALQSQLAPDGPDVSTLAGQFAGLLLAASTAPGRG